MSNRHVRLSGVVFVAAALIGWWAVATPRAVGQPRSGLVGSWKSVLVPANEEAPLITLFTITSDGALIQTTSAGPSRSTLHGTWAPTGQDSLAFTAWRLIYDEDGRLVRTLKARGQYQLESADVLVGRSVVETRDLADLVVDSTTTTTRAERIVVESLE